MVPAPIMTWVKISGSFFTTCKNPDLVAKIVTGDGTWDRKNYIYLRRPDSSYSSSSTLVRKDVASTFISLEDETTLISFGNCRKVRKMGRVKFIRGNEPYTSVCAEEGEKCEKMLSNWRRVKFKKGRKKRIPKKPYPIIMLISSEFNEMLQELLW
ncbi:hypothetical protein ACFE04_021568 [Oxalis oulophora]